MWQPTENYEAYLTYNYLDDDSDSRRTQMEDRTLVAAHITYRDPEEKYYLTLWGLNLTDETYRTAANSVAGLWNFTMYGRPRSYGMEFGVSF